MEDYLPPSSGEDTAAGEDTPRGDLHQRLGISGGRVTRGERVLGRGERAVRWWRGERVAAQRTGDEVPPFKGGRKKS